MDSTGRNKIVCTTWKRGNEFRVYFFDREERKDYVLKCTHNEDINFSYDPYHSICTFSFNEEFDLPFYENENHEITFPIETQRQLWEALVESGFKRVK